MRKILFRGKSIYSGEWIFGDYMSGGYIVEDADSPRSVETETIGQFTGLTDKNGKKIFEGDIVKHYCEHREDGIISIGVVFWDEKRCMFLRTSTAGNETPQIWADCEYEVISNIHDRLELLETT